jgi:hypothetical protein
MTLPELCASMCLPACFVRRNSGDIRIDHCLPVFVRVLRGGRAPNGSGVIDQNIDAAKMVDYLFS